MLEVNQHLLFTAELTSTGISYVEHLDCLFIAPGLVGHSPITWEITVEPSPSDVISLLRRGDVYVGVICYSFKHLVYRYLNGGMPDEGPALLIADVVDLYTADPEWPPKVRYGNYLEEVREVHQRARELISSGGIVPKYITDQIKKVIGNYRETLH